MLLQRMDGDWGDVKEGGVRGGIEWEYNAKYFEYLTQSEFGSRLGRTTNKHPTHPMIITNTQILKIIQNKKNNIKSVTLKVIRLLITKNH